MKFKYKTILGKGNYIDPKNLKVKLKSDYIQRIISVQDKENYYLVKYISKLCPIDDPTEMETVFSKVDGSYLGSEDYVKNLMKLGIDLLTVKNSSIGFIPEENKWAGWSHRALVKFGIGDRIFEERYGDENTPFIKHGKNPIKNMDDAKKAATNFAEYVATVMSNNIIYASNESELLSR